MPDSNSANPTAPAAPRSPLAAGAASSNRCLWFASVARLFRQLMQASREDRVVRRTYPFEHISRLAELAKHNGFAVVFVGRQLAVWREKSRC